MRRDGRIVGVGTVTLGNDTTETSIIPDAKIRHTDISLVENELKEGSTIRLRLRGYIGSKAQAPGDLTLNLYLGETAIGAAVLATPAGLSDDGLDLDVIATVLTAGAEGACVWVGDSW